MTGQILTQYLEKDYKIASIHVNPLSLAYFSKRILGFDHISLTVEIGNEICDIIVDETVALDQFIIHYELTVVKEAIRVVPFELHD